MMNQDLLERFIPIEPPIFEERDEKDLPEGFLLRPAGRLVCLAAGLFTGAIPKHPDNPFP
jgi:hypothetical protein